MANLYDAGELATIIKKLAFPDLEDVGTTDDEQNSFIFYYMNIAMFKLAKLASQAAYSNAMTLSADGYVTFQKSDGTDISDMFEPKYITQPNGRPLQNRTSEDAPKGWWRESEANQINIRGFSLSSQPLESGSYTLCYLKYPNKITLTTDQVEFPPSGYDTLIKEVLTLMKYSGNQFAQAEFLDTQAKQGYNNVAQAAISARGTGQTGQSTGFNDASKARGG